VRLHYIEWGDPGDPLVLALHGTGDSCHTWEPFAAMASRSFHIIAMDQRGHGDSDWIVPPAYSGEDYVGDLEAFIEELGLEKPILLGHSMGALHCTTYTSMRPRNVAALIHVDIEPCPPPWNRRYLCGLYEKLPESYESEDDFVAQLRQTAPYAGEELLCRLASRSLEHSGDGRLAYKGDREVYAHFDPAYDLRERLRFIKTPALVVRGQESRVMSSGEARTMARALPRGKLVEIPRATHPVHLDNPEAFGRAVLDFLEGLGLMTGKSGSRTSQSG
jgi:pimeloyl-ACP methyl ester carboxylesterase